MAIQNKNENTRRINIDIVIEENKILREKNENLVNEIKELIHDIDSMAEENKMKFRRISELEKQLNEKEGIIYNSNNSVNETIKGYMKTNEENEITIKVLAKKIARSEFIIEGQETIIENNQNEIRNLKDEIYGLKK